MIVCPFCAIAPYEDVEDDPVDEADRPFSMCRCMRVTVWDDSVHFSVPESSCGTMGREVLEIRAGMGFAYLTVEGSGNGRRNASLREAFNVYAAMCDRFLLAQVLES